MPGLAEIINSLAGACLLAKRDLAGYRRFNQTIEGFWRSFAAVLLIAPMYFLFAGLELDMHSQPPVDAEAVRDASRTYIAMALGLGLDWIAFPIVFIFVSRGLGLSHRYVRYIIAFNWTSVIAVAVLMVPRAAFYLGAISANAFGGLSLLFLLPVLYYRWFVAKTALETTGLIASVPVLLELTLSAAISKYSLQFFA